jgi:hypothetical protein
MIGYIFVREWYAIGHGMLPAELLIQEDDRTFRRQSGEELTAFEQQHPGAIYRLRRSRSVDEEDL